MVKRRSPRKHVVRTKHPRYHISRYQRGKLNVPVRSSVSKDGATVVDVNPFGFTILGFDGITYDELNVVTEPNRKVFGPNDEDYLTELIKTWNLDRRKKQKYVYISKHIDPDKNERYYLHLDKNPKKCVRANGALVNYLEKRIKPKYYIPIHGGKGFYPGIFFVGEHGAGVYWDKHSL